MRKPQKVYFIKPVGLDGPIKIGCSYSPEGRRKTLDTWSPFALEIVAEIDGGFDLERRFHALFVETHQRREWFGQSKRLGAVIAAIQDGSFDVETLPAPICISGTKSKGYVSPNKGRKWSEREHEQYRRAAPLRKAERASGLCLPYFVSEEQRNAFIANPCRETGGMTRPEREAYMVAWRADRGLHSARTPKERLAA